MSIVIIKNGLMTSKCELVWKMGQQWEQDTYTEKEDTADGLVLARPLTDGFAPFGSKFQARTLYINVNPATDEHTPGLSPSWAVCSALWVPVSLSQTSRSSLADPGQIPTCSCCESGSPSAAVHCSNIRKDKIIKQFLVSRTESNQESFCSLMPTCIQSKDQQN